LNIDYITVTINTLLPETAIKIHPIKDIENYIIKQIEGVKMLKETNSLIKINSVFLSGINENDLIDVAKFAGQTGVFAQNIIPFYPVKDCVFKNIKSPSFNEVDIVRDQCLKYVRQLSHCKQCRADAVGYI
jgi:nitrogen fixation protein NifB